MKLGDFVAKVLSWIGFHKDDCGKCQRRQAYLNDLGSRISSWFATIWIAFSAHFSTKK